MPTVTHNGVEYPEQEFVGGLMDHLGIVPSSGDPKYPTPAQGQGGAPAENTQDKDVQSWMDNYINSAKYKERLGNTWQHPDIVQKAREDKTAATTFTQTKGGTTDYSDTSSFPNQVNVSEDQIKNLNATRAEAVAHELGHGTNANPTSKLLQLNPVEENYIISRNKNVAAKDIPDYLKSAQDTGMGGLSNYLKASAGTHDLAPSESMSDIQALRYLLHKKGIYDAGNEDMTPEVLKKAANDPDIKNSFIWKRLHDNFDDKGILDINNTIAYGGQKGIDNIA